VTIWSKRRHQSAPGVLPVRFDLATRLQESQFIIAGDDHLAGGELPWSVKHFDPVKPMWLLTQPDPTYQWLGLETGLV
jgi:hypothetical protein